MKIIVKRNEQQAKITFDLKDVYYPDAIRDTIQIALELDGFTKETIAKVFNADVKINPPSPPTPLSGTTPPLINCVYQPDGSSAMNCKNCGKGKFFHGVV
jgi:hypothetical protein